jgi:hypothetical protein
VHVTPKSVPCRREHLGTVTEPVVPEIHPDRRFR